MESVDVRFELEDGTNIGSFLETVGRNLPYVMSAQVLENTGFGHILPVGEKLDFVEGKF